MKYDIAARSSRSELVLFVNSMTKKGWKPQGGIIIDIFPKGTRYYLQAMVKE